MRLRREGGVNEPRWAGVTLGWIQKIKVRVTRMHAE